MLEITIKNLKTNEVVLHSTASIICGAFGSEGSVNRVSSVSSEDGGDEVSTIINAILVMKNVKDAIQDMENRLSKIAPMVYKKSLEFVENHEDDFFKPSKVVKNKIPIGKKSAEAEKPAEPVEPAEPAEPAKDEPVMSKEEKDAVVSFIKKLLEF